MEKNDPVGLELEQAVELLQKHVKPVVRTETLPLEQTLGRRVANTVYAPVACPPFDRSPLDGYAVRAQEIAGASQQPVRLPVAGVAYAGAPFAERLPPNTAVRIMTGARMPAGSDCVVRQEDTDYGEDYVQIFRPVKAWQNYCFCGEDFLAGTQLVQAGERLDAVRLGILASAGLAQLPVLAPVKVALLCTGDELAPLGTPLTSGKIYNSNRYLLQARIRELGLEAVCLPACADEAETLAQALAQACAQADIVLTTGGVSVGTRDKLHEALAHLGANRLFWRVRMKPGSPLLCAEYQQKLLLCLSGNPFAALASFELVVRPVLAALCKDKQLLLKSCEATLCGSFPKGGGARRFVRSFYENGQVHLQAGNHASGALLLMAGCNCFVDIPQSSPPLVGGERVRVVLL